MKVKRSPQNEFTPFTIEITVTSEEEARALYAIFNHTDNIRLLKSKEAEDIRNAIGWSYRVLGSSDIIANGVTYSQFYQQTRPY